MTFWTSPGEQSTHVPLADVLRSSPEDEAEFFDATSGRNAYFGLASRARDLGPSRQGRRRDLLALPAVVVDVDFADSRAHRAVNYPADAADAAYLLEDLPSPSAVVSTGHGEHVYWFFRDALPLRDAEYRRRVGDAVKAFHARLRERAAKRGHRLDPTETLQRVWRVPGTVNQKSGAPVVLRECWEDRRYDLRELGLDVPVASSRGSAPLLPQPEPPVDPVAVNTEKKIDADAVRKELARVRPGNAYADACRAAAEGRSLAPRGSRDEALQGVCATLAALRSARGASPDDLAEVLRPALAAWASEPGARLSEDEEVAKARDKIERNQHDLEDKRRSAAESNAGIERAMGLAPAESPAESTVAPGPRTLADPRHAIVQYKNMYFIWHFGLGRYLDRPYQQQELWLGCHDAWEDSTPPEFSLYYQNDRGEWRKKKAADLPLQYGTCAREVVAYMTLQESEFESETKTFRESATRFRVTDAEFDPQIDEWLRLLGGEHYEKLCDWVACVPELDRQNSALYLSGKSGAGKGMLAHGLAGLWSATHTPTPFEKIIGTNNSMAVKCPLIWIDEGLPDRIGNVTKELRSLVGNNSLFVCEKWEPPRTCHGAVRLVICANNDDVLSIGASEMTVDDLEAVVGRILHVRVGEDAAGFLADNKHRIDGWVEGDGIARHCLWLRENRRVEPGRRFLVEGDETAMHRALATRGTVNSLIYEWVVRFASKPRVLYNNYVGRKERPLAIVGNGEVKVNSQGIVDCWDTYMSRNSRCPAVSQIGGALRRMAHGTKRIGARGDRVRYWCVRPTLLLEWCRVNQVGDEDAIEDHIYADSGFEE